MLEQKVSLWEKIKRSKVGLPLLILLIGGGVAALLVANKPEVEQEEAEFPPLVVEVASASLDQAQRTALFQGEVRAKTDINLVTQVTGKVTKVSDKFIEGGQFEKDEIILEIDDADYRVALKSAQATVAEAQVQLDLELASAETSKNEWRDLYGESLENANPLRLNKPQVDRARARLEAASAQYAQAKLDFDRTKIRAPFSGRIQSKGAELGQFVARGSGVGRMFSTDSVEIRIPMSDLQISELGLTLGQIPNSQQRIPASVKSHFGNDDYVWQGYLKSVDASVDNETRLLFGTIVVEQPFALSEQNSIPLAPGLFVDVELDAAQSVTGVSVPRTALRSGDTIYVVQDNQLKFKRVKPVFTSPEVAVLSTETQEALLPGERVVVSPVPGAFAGMSVEIKGEQEAKPDEQEPAEQIAEPSEPSGASDGANTAVQASSNG